MISGVGGSLVKTGAGTLTLGGANTYSGGTTINGGVLAVSTDSNLGGGAVQFGGGTLQATATLSTNRAMTLAGDGTLQTDFGTTLTANGVIDGGGRLTKTDLGTLILTGVNTYSGGTTVSAGILQGNTLSLQGSIVNNATVVFEQGGTGSYVGNMSGSGGLTKRGAGALTLSGTNSQLGTTRIEGGALSVGSDANLGGASAGLFLDGGTLRTTASFSSTAWSGCWAVAAPSTSPRAPCLQRQRRGHPGAGQPDQDRRRHAGADRQQHLRRRHDDLGGHAADRRRQHDRLDHGQRGEQRRAGLQPQRLRHLRRRYLGQRLGAAERRRLPEAHGQQQLCRRHHDRHRLRHRLERRQPRRCGGRADAA